jgi:type IV secretion system protein VirB6
MKGIIKLIVKLIIISIGFTIRPALASVYDDDFSNATSSNAYGCLNPPTFDYTNSDSLAVNYSNNNWVDSGISVESGKQLLISWDTLNSTNTTDNIRKYRVLYKVDPRFPRSQLMIARFDKVQNKYIWDFDEYRNGYFKGTQAASTFADFTCTSTTATDCSNRVTYFNNVKDYINFIDRTKISLSKGDVVNIKLLDKSEFFKDGISDINDSPSLITRVGYDKEFPRFTLYSDVGNFNNAILYYNQQLAYATYASDKPSYTTRVKTFLGIMDKPSMVGGLPSCSASSTGLTNPACLYDQGRGMEIQAGSNVIKPGNNIFLSHNNEYLYYYKAKQDETLDFTENFSKSGIFTFANPSNLNACTLHAEVTGQDVCNFNTNYLYIGRYLMEIEIGPGDGVKETHNPDIQLEYYISNTTPSPSTSGTILTAHYFKGDASTSGKLWFRVTNKNPGASVSGQVIIHYSGYNGTNMFSTFINKYLVDPLRDQFQKLSKQLYSGIVKEATFTKSVKALLTLYIVIYGLYFLAGGIQLSLKDLVGRVVKISIIIALLSEQSWDFFNNNLFSILIGGMDYLITKVVGYSSSSNNIFGFMDPILQRYLQPQFWGLMLVYLFQLHNGLWVIGIILIFGTLNYVKVVLEIVINYIIAMLALFVLFSLAPIFIIMILFSATRHLFDHWLSLLFNYAIQPTILLLMVLIVDQVIADQLGKILLPACWDIILPLKFNIDLNHIIPGFVISFGLPFLPGIPFFVVDLNGVSSASRYYNVMNAAFIFFIFAKMARGMADYVTQLTSQLTGTFAARQQGELNQGRGNLVSDIKHSLIGKEGVVGKGISIAKSARNSLSVGLKNADKQAKQNVKDDHDN